MTSVFLVFLNVFHLRIWDVNGIQQVTKCMITDGDRVKEIIPFYDFVALRSHFLCLTSPIDFFERCSYGSPMSNWWAIKKPRDNVCQQRKLSGPWNVMRSSSRFESVWVLYTFFGLFWNFIQKCKNAQFGSETCTQYFSSLHFLLILFLLLLPVKNFLPVHRSTFFP